MTIYRSVGNVPRKRHVVHHDHDGTRLREELLGTRGFSGPSSLLYHRRSPSDVRDVAPVEELRSGQDTLRPNHPVAPFHLRTHDLPDDLGFDLVRHRRILAANDDLTIAVVNASAASPLYRDVAGDELVHVESGSALLETTFGPLEVHPGDYVVVPAGTTHRWVPVDPVRALVIEMRGHLSFPDRYRGDNGQFLEHAPFCERDLRAPEAPSVEVGTDIDVLVRTRHGLTAHRHATHPFDVVGWDGTLYPYALSIHDFEPIVGSLHQPPPVHQTFAGPGFVVCSFVPRPFDFHPDAVKIPYHHSNVDSDEVLFYVDGDFMSRAGSGIGIGSMSIHPAGFVHGPQPGSFDASVDATRTEETAVMIDTFAPLQISEVARSISDPGYGRTWTER
ncbi:MAG: homogentisate 1,2-dioxygenase [Acidimicrobiales bacterium]|nr:homogentisate 1,2-dioxygenase [Acidimicrobiales bacterium]